MGDLPAVAAGVALVVFVVLDLVACYWIAGKVGLVRWLEEQPWSGLGAESSLSPFGRRVVTVGLSVFFISIPVQGCLILVAGALAAAHVI